MNRTSIALYLLIELFPITQQAFPQNSSELKTTIQSNSVMKLNSMSNKILQHNTISNTNKTFGVINTASSFVSIKQKLRVSDKIPQNYEENRDSKLLPQFISRVDSKYAPISTGNNMNEQLQQNENRNVLTESGNSLLNDLRHHLNISGFFEAAGSINTAVAKNSNNRGQFELALAKSFSSGISIEGALAYNSEGGKLEIGTGYIDFKLQHDSIQSNDFVDNIGISFGQFDVPFGIDYKYIAPPDRKLITAPLVVQKNLDGLNCLGVMLNAEMKCFNFKLYGIDGFSENTFIFGGRLGVTNSHNIEIGTSYISNFIEQNPHKKHVCGFDIQVNYESVDIKGEFILSEGILEGKACQSAITGKQRGYYLQTLMGLNDIISLPIFASLRYGKWLSPKNSIDRVTAGTGFVFTQTIEARIEYIIHKEKLSQFSNVISWQLIAHF